MSRRTHNTNAFTHIMCIPCDLMVGSGATCRRPPFLIHSLIIFNGSPAGPLNFYSIFDFLLPGFLPLRLVACRRIKDGLCQFRGNTLTQARLMQMAELHSHAKLKGVKLRDVPKSSPPQIGRIILFLSAETYRLRIRNAEPPLTPPRKSKMSFAPQSRRGNVPVKCLSRRRVVLEGATSEAVNDRAQAAQQGQHY